MARPTFVGRSDELDLLCARHREAGAGQPQTVLVEGPAGVGKSALLSAFSHSVEPGSSLTASGDEAETFLSYGILLQLLDSRLASWSHPFEAGADLLQFLDQRHGKHATLFVVDDAHLADSDSMTALTFALRRLQADRVMAVFAVRSDQTDRLPPGLLRLVEAQGGRLTLAGLSDHDVVELGLAHGRGRMSRPSAVRLRDHTAGNPLYLTALLSELPAAELNATGPLPAPQSYALVVLGALGTHSEDARALARAAAVLADSSHVDVAAAVAGLSMPEPALQELTAARLMTCQYADGGWNLRYAHPLTKAAVYDDLGPTERSRLHSLAAEHVHGEESLLHRVAAARGPDPVIADGLARCADANQARGKLRRAAELYLAAARMGGVSESADAHLMDAVGLFLLAGDVSATMDLSETLGKVAPSARRFHLQAKVAQLAGQPQEAEELATQAWARGEELDPQGRGPLAAILAQLCNLRGDGEAAAMWAERALAHDLPSDLNDSTAAARAMGLTIAGHLSDALAQLERDLPSDPATTHRGQHHQLCARGALRTAVDDLPGALADLALLSVTSGSDLAPNRLVATGVLAEVEYRIGNWDRSFAVALQALSLAEDTGQVWIQGFLHNAIVRVAAGRGDWDEARQHLDAAAGMATALHDPATFAVCEDTAVHVAFCRGKPEEVVARSALLHSLDIGPTREPGLMDWPVRYAAALVELGQFDEAGEEITVIEGLARDRGSRSRLAAMARVRGELATARREHEAARAAFEESLTLGAGNAAALDSALTQASYGRFLRRRGEKRAAVGRLQASREMCVALGATPFVQRCDAELSACGVNRLPDDSPRRPALTPQEQIVAGLVCEGLTNQQVARQMVLSVKTVGYHLSNIYTKLDIHSRTQLVAVLGRSS